MCRIYQAGLCEFSKCCLDALSAQYHCIGIAATAICLLEAVFLVQARDDPIRRAASAADMAAVQTQQLLAPARTYYVALLPQVCR